MRVVLFVVLGYGVVWSTARGQARQVPTGSRYLPVDHWAYEYITRLQDRGYLTALNPLVQPYRRMDVARDLAALPDTLPAPAGQWMRLLRAEFAAELNTLAGQATRGWGIELQAGARGAGSRRLDPLRPLGGGKVWPWARGGGWVEVGPIAAETRGYDDRYFRDDPDGADPQPSGNPVSDNAYVSVTLPFGALVVGRMARNWGPIGEMGLMVSEAATPYPQLGLELSKGRLTFRWFVGELDSLLRGDTTGFRYLAAHRLDYRTRGLTVSLGESSVIAAPDAGLQFRFLNPMEFLYLNQDTPPNDITSSNATVDGQLWLRRKGVVFYVDALLDDIDLHPDTTVANPPRYAFTVGLQFPSLAPWVEPGIEYQQVGAWTYRTTHLVDRYSFLNRGLGANYSDYDRLSVWADLYPWVPGLRLTPVLVLQRQGEGSFRDPIPTGRFGFAGQPALFLGVMERTLRLALRARYQPLGPLWLSWDVGPNFVTNKDHVTGVNTTQFMGTGGFGVRLEFP